MILFEIYKALDKLNKQMAEQNKLLARQADALESIACDLCVMADDDSSND